MSDKEPWGENISDQSFEFKQEFWEEAEELLSKDRKTSVLKKTSMVLATLFFISLWTWWANDQHGIFISENQTEITDNLTYIDTADQLSPEKFRVKPPKLTPISSDGEEDFEQIMASNNKSSTSVKSSNSKKHIDVKSNTRVVNAEKSLAVKSNFENKNIAEQELNAIGSLSPEFIESEVYNKELELNGIEIDTEINKKTPVVKRSRFNVSAGTGVNLTTNSTVNNLSQNFNLSLNYAFYRNEKLSLEAGLGVKTLQIHGIDTSFVNKTYGFGSKQRIMDVNYNKNYYVYMPLSLTYHHKNHQLRAGVNLGYLAATETSLATRKIEFKSNENTLENKIDKNFGIDEGMQKVLFEASIGYAYQISPKIDLGLQVDFGVNDFTDNQFWNNNTKNSNISGMVQLKYHFPTIKH